MTIPYPNCVLRIAKTSEQRASQGSHIHLERQPAVTVCLLAFTLWSSNFSLFKADLRSSRKKKILGPKIV